MNENSEIITSELPIEDVEVPKVEVYALPINKRVGWRALSPLATYYLSGVNVQGLEFDPNSPNANIWNHNLRSFANSVARNQDYSLSPHTQYNITELHDLARHFNNFNLNNSLLNTGNIRPRRMLRQYMSEHPETSQEDQNALLNEYERLQSNERNNRREFRRARRVAGSDRQSLSDREFYSNLGNFVTGVVSLPSMMYTPSWIGGASTAGRVANIGSKVLTGARNLFTNGITNKFARDFMIGATTGMVADELIRQTTPYEGIADGFIMQVADPNFRQSGWYTPALFAAEMINPINWINPVSVATKTGLSRSFDGLGNELNNGFIDPSNMHTRTQQLGNSDYLEVDLMHPREIFEIFRQNPRIRTIRDIGHNATYTDFVKGNSNLAMGPYTDDILHVNGIPIHRNTYFDNNIADAAQRDTLDEQSSFTTTSPQWEGYIFDRGDVPPVSYTRHRPNMSAELATRLNTFMNNIKNNSELTGGPYLSNIWDNIHFDTKHPFSKYAYDNNGNRVEIDLRNGELHTNYEGNYFSHNSDGTLPYFSILNPKPNLFVQNKYTNFFGGMDSANSYYGNGRLRFAVDNSRHIASITEISNNPQLLVSENGEINLSGWNTLKSSLANKLNISVEKINEILGDGPGSLNEHLLSTAYSAQTMPLPRGVTRQELVLGALLHDIGRIQFMVGDDSTHAIAGRELLNELSIEGLSNDILTAINYHADREALSAFNKHGIIDGINYPLLQAISAADVSRGLHYQNARQEYPYLFGYDSDDISLPSNQNFNDQINIINDYLIKKHYSPIDTSLSENEQWSQLRSAMERANTYIRGVGSGSENVIRDLGLTNQNEIDSVLATMPVRRYNRQMGTFDDRYFSKFIGVNPNENGTVYVANTPNISNRYGSAYTIRRGSPENYDRIDGEQPIQYFGRLMPFYMHNYKISDQFLTRPRYSLPSPPNMNVPESIVNLYKRFGFTEDDANWNYYAYTLDSPATMQLNLINNPLHITDLPGFRDNLMFMPYGDAAAFVGPYYKPAFYILHEGVDDTPLSTIRKHGGKLNNFQNIWKLTK